MGGRFHFLISKSKALFIIIGFFLLYHSSFAQIVHAGFKAGASMNWVRFDNPSFGDTVKATPYPGFDVGGVLSFKVRDRYFLHTEYVYSQKGKNLQGKIDPLLHDKVTYHYFEIPVLFTMHFKSKVGKSREFKWYLGAGPNISYWISGNGHLQSSDLKENFVDQIDYKVVFAERMDTQHPRDIYYPNANRLQFGLNIGAGLMFEPGVRNKVMVDFRYGFDQTRLGKGLADYQIPSDFDDNLRVRNWGFKASIIYLTEFNLDKKSRNKGKSTKKIK